MTIPDTFQVTIGLDTDPLCLVAYWVEAESEEKARRKLCALLPESVDLIFEDGTEATLYINRHAAKEESF